MSCFNCHVYFLRTRIVCTKLVGLGLLCTAAIAQDPGMFPLNGTTPDVVLPDSHGTEFKLSQFFENHRILLILVPAEATLDAKGYLANLAKNERKLLERDLQVVVVVNEDSPLLQQQYPASIIVAIRKEYIPAFTPGDSAAPLCVLIEKDKSVKLREPTFVDFSALINKIDSMPMRRAEMKARHN